MASQNGMVDPSIFEDLQARVDEDTAVRDVRMPRSNHDTDWLLTPAIGIARHCPGARKTE